MAICATRSALPTANRPCPCTTPRPFDLSAALGSTRAARSAGMRPNTSPVSTATPTLNPSTRRSSARSRKIGLPAGARNLTSSLHPHCASTSPMPAPSSEINTLSVSSWRTRRFFAAPSATRIASSRWRAADRAISRFATLAQAMSSTSTTMPMSANSAPVYMSRNDDNPLPAGFVVNDRSRYDACISESQSFGSVDVTTAEAISAKPARTRSGDTPPLGRPITERNHRLRSSSVPGSPFKTGLAQSATNTCVDLPTSRPANPGCDTPMMRTGCESSEIVLPTTLGSAPYSVRQNASLSTAVGSQPRWSSAVDTSRPAAGCTPSVRK